MWNTTTLLERLLTQETRFLRYPRCFRPLERTVLPETAREEVLGESASTAHLERGLRQRRRALLDRHEHLRCAASADELDAHIMATDISREALERADRGSYTRRALENLSPSQIATLLYARWRAIQGEAGAARTW